MAAHSPFNSTVDAFNPQHQYTCYVKTMSMDGCTHKVTGCFAYILCYNCKLRITSDACSFLRQEGLRAADSRAEHGGRTECKVLSRRHGHF